jgi:transcriptional regulator with XRE-family HTH domain
MRLDHERVRWHRDRLGWTLDTLAEKAEVAKGTVLRAEHGEDVRPSSGRRIAKALGTEISELIPDKPERVRELAAPLAKAPGEAGHSVAQRLEDLQTYEAHISKIAEKYHTEAEPLLVAVGDADKPTEKDLDSLKTLLTQTGWTFDGGYEYLKHDDVVVQAERGAATERHAVAKVKSALNAILDIHEAIDAALDPHLDPGEEESRVVTRIEEYRQRRAG